MFHDVNNVALGHAARMRWNPAGKWLFSEQMAHPPIIGKEQVERAQAILAGRGNRTAHKVHRGPARMPSVESWSGWPRSVCSRR